MNSPFDSDGINITSENVSEPPDCALIKEKEINPVKTKVLIGVLFI
jgi:hypothetical protein